MNAGFSNLKTLKRELLLPADATKSDSDASVAALGLGVAAMFQVFCNRKFGSVVGDTFEIGADRYSLVVPRYPIEAISKVEVRYAISDGWVVQPGMPDNYLPEAGLVQFCVPLGVWPNTARVTYTGGYWWDTGEVTPDTMPEGAWALPEDLRAAWVMQCRWFWERRSITDRAKAGFTDAIAEKGFAATEDDLLLSVRHVLDAYRRIA